MQEDLHSARTHEKSVQAQSRARRPALWEAGPDPKEVQRKLLRHYLFELESKAVQVSIEEEEDEEYRLRMLRDAVNQVTVEPASGIVKMKAEAIESYPSDNYDWSKSGIFRQIVAKYESDKERLAKR